MKLSTHIIPISTLESRISGLKQKYPWIDWSLVSVEPSGSNYLQIHYNQSTCSPDGQSISLDDYSIRFERSEKS